MPGSPCRWPAQRPAISHSALPTGRSRARGHHHGSAQHRPVTLRRPREPHPRWDHEPEPGSRGCAALAPAAHRPPGTRTATAITPNAITTANRSRFMSSSPGSWSRARRFQHAVSVRLLSHNPRSVNCQSCQPTVSESPAVRTRTRAPEDARSSHRYGLEVSRSRSCRRSRGRCSTRRYAPCGRRTWRTPAHRPRR